MQPDTKRALERLDAFLDDQFRALPIMAMPRAEALAHSLRTAEFKTLLTEEHAYRNHDLNLLWPARRLSQDALRHLVFQLHKHTTPGGTPRATGHEEFIAAALLLSLCERYSAIDDSLTLCRLELGELREGPPDTYRVQMRDAGAERRLAARFPGRESEKLLTMSRPPSRGDEPEAIRLFEDIRRRIACLGEGGFTFYRPAVLPEAVPIAQGTVQQLDRTLPTEWSIGPYTLEEFWRFWTVLLALTMLQRLAATAV